MGWATNNKKRTRMFAVSVCRCRRIEKLQCSHLFFSSHFRLISSSPLAFSSSEIVLRATRSVSSASVHGERHFRTRVLSASKNSSRFRPRRERSEFPTKNSGNKMLTIQTIRRGCRLFAWNVEGETMTISCCCVINVTLHATRIVVVWRLFLLDRGSVESAKM